MTSRWDTLKTPPASYSSSKSHQHASHLRTPPIKSQQEQSQSFSNSPNKKSSDNSRWNLHRHTDGSVRGNGPTTKPSFYKSTPQNSTESSPVQRKKNSGSDFSKQKRYYNSSTEQSAACLSKTAKTRMHVNISKLRSEIDFYRDKLQMKLDNKSRREISSPTKETVHDFSKNLRISASKLLVDITQCNHTSSPNGIKSGVQMSEALYLIFQGAGVLEQSLEGRIGKDEEENLEDLLIQVWNDVTKAILLSERTSYDVNKNIVSSLKLAPEQIQECASILVARMKYILRRKLSVDGTNGNVTRIHYGSVCLSEQELKKAYSISQCLRYVIISFGRDLHAELSVGSIVRCAILPLLELDSILPMDKAMKNIKVVAMECIIAIVRWKQHASAILAPLIVDVGSSGEEKYHVNPLKGRLLHRIQQILIGTSYNDTWDVPTQCCACHCLYSVLDQIHLIEKAQSGKMKLAQQAKKVSSPHKQKKDYDRQIEAGEILRWIHKHIQNNRSTNRRDERTLRWHCLKLLSAFIRVYPQACTQQWSLFLGQVSNGASGAAKLMANNLSTLPHQVCQKNEIVTLLPILSSDYFVDPAPTLDEKIIAITVTRELLSALPLRLWTSVSKRAMTVSSSEYLSGRANQSLLLIINCIESQISMCQSNEVLIELCQLAKVIIVSVPFDAYDLLVEPTVLLLHRIGECLKYHHSEDCHVVANVLADCMGGVETPQGSLTPLPIPSRVWLDGPLSYSFVQRIFVFMENVGCGDDSDAEVVGNNIVNLFLTMLRSVTWVLIEDEQKRDMFSGIVHNLTSKEDVSLRLIGIHLLQAFFKGKQIELQKNACENLKNTAILVRSILPFLHRMLRDSDATIRKGALSAYGSMQFSDWEILLLDDANPFTFILSLCLEYSGDPDSKVRQEACRSVGHIVSVCMDAKRENQYNHQMKQKLSTMVEGAIQVTGSAIDDSNAGVRSMALFGIGNIAVAVVDNGAREEDVLHKIPLIQFCDATFERLHDSNEKVVGNGIRTIGHLFHLLYNFHDIVQIRTDDSDKWIRLCGNVANALAKKIQIALLDATDLSNQRRSWRHRSHAKRHAWGACHALSSLLGCNAARAKDNREGVKAALHQLIRCVELAHIINEKIAVSAMSTLQEIPHQTWTSNTGDLVGQCLAACLIQAGAITKASIGLKREVFEDGTRSMISNVMEWVNHQDILICLSHQDVSHSTINFMYSWMVENKIQSKRYEQFGIALQCSEFSSDISLIQKFQSRAAFRERQEQEPVQVELYQELTCQDEDEL